MTHDVTHEFPYEVIHIRDLPSGVDIWAIGTTEFCRRRINAWRDGKGSPGSWMGGPLDRPGRERDCYVVVRAADMWPSRRPKLRLGPWGEVTAASTGNYRPKPVIPPPTDAEIVAAFERFMRKEAIGPSVGGIDMGTHVVSMEFARAAWSRELRRLAAESAKRNQLPCQGTLPEDL